MLWRNEIPKEDGFYWARYYADKNIVSVSQVRDGGFMGFGKDYEEGEKYVKRYNILFGDKIEIPHEPDRNAVIVEWVNDKFAVHIECNDKEKKWLLEDMAKDILQTCI